MMSRVAQGTLKVIRDEMFEKMQKLPIRYFDTHTHGEIMSYYTNDADTLRELISRGIPEIVSMIITIGSTFIAMVYTSPYLTIVVLFILFAMLKLTKNIGGKSSTHFMRQQETLSKVDGYIEEMINGQKVIKVFSHEEQAIEDFKKLNEKLCNDTTTANRYSNILMPALANLGNIQYVLIGAVRWFICHSGNRWINNRSNSLFLKFKQKFFNANCQIIKSN